MRRRTVRPAIGAAIMSLCCGLLATACTPPAIHGRAIAGGAPDAPVDESVDAPPGTGSGTPKLHSVPPMRASAPNANWDSPPRTVQAGQVAHPYAAVIGKLFAHFSSDPGNSFEECTATAVTSQNKSTVWTSAHCINPGTAGKFAYGEFVPGFNDDGTATPDIDPWDPSEIQPHAPYGVFTISHVWTPAGWKAGYDGSGSVSDDVYGVDYGAAVVSRNNSGQTLDDAIGSAAKLSFDPPLNQVEVGVTVIGYPGDAPYDGTAAYECSQAPQVLPIPGHGKEFRIGCTMTAGSSGGPWVATVNGSGVIVGNTSFTNGDGNPSSRWLTATMLTHGAQQLYQNASTYPIG